MSKVDFCRNIVSLLIFSASMMSDSLGTENNKRLTSKASETSDDDFELDPRLLVLDPLYDPSYCFDQHLNTCPVISHVIKENEEIDSTEVRNGKKFTKGSRKIIYDDGEYIEKPFLILSDHCSQSSKKESQDEK